MSNTTGMEMRKYIDIINESTQQLNEYFVREGDQITDVLSHLNVFVDIIGEEALVNHNDEFAKSSDWQDVISKYKPYAQKLHRVVSDLYKKTGATLTQEHVDEAERLIYDGSDAYDDVNVALDELPSRYRAQIMFVNRLVKDFS